MDLLLVKSLAAFFLSPGRSRLVPAQGRHARFRQVAAQARLSNGLRKARKCRSAGLNRLVILGENYVSFQRQQRAQVEQGIERRAKMVRPGDADRPVRADQGL